MAKTLIHEAFHIIRGCWTVDTVTKRHTQKDEKRCFSKDVCYLYQQLNVARQMSMMPEGYTDYWWLRFLGSDSNIAMNVYDDDGVIDY